MKSMLRIATFVVVTLLVASFALAGDHPKPTPVCSNATLFGSYGFRDAGEVFKPFDLDNEYGPNTVWDDRDERLKVNPLKLRGIAELTFDGEGNFTYEDEQVLEGKSISTFATSKSTGTYKVNADCTGSLYVSLTDRRMPLDIDIVVDEEGDQVQGVVNTCGGRRGLLDVSFEGVQDFDLRHHDHDRD